MRRVFLLAFAPFVFVPAKAWAQGNPLGAEFRANTYTTGDQSRPAVAVESTGNFLVVWQSNGQDGSSDGIFGQRYASSGAPIGPEVRVNGFTGEFQRNPSVSADPSGNFVVAWNSGACSAGYPTTCFANVFGQRYAGSGTPVGPEFRVNTFTGNLIVQYQPSVAADSAGNFLVAWTRSDGYQYPFFSDVFAQRFAASGVPLGTEFRVNAYTTLGQRSPCVATGAAGNFIVVWQGYSGGSGYEVFGQRFASSGVPLGAEFRINTSTAFHQVEPEVSADAAGSFVVVWLSRDGSGYGVFGQRFAASGALLGPEFRVNASTTGEQGMPVVVADPAGNFVAVWESPEGSSSNEIFGQRYAASGTPLGPQFRVNTHTTDDQQMPFVAADSSGAFVIVWASAYQDGSTIGKGIFGQRYGQIVPVELTDLRVQ